MNKKEFKKTIQDTREGNTRPTKTRNKKGITEKQRKTQKAFTSMPPLGGSGGMLPPKNIYIYVLSERYDLSHISKYPIHENFRSRKGYLIEFYSIPGQPHGGSPYGGI